MDIEFDPAKDAINHRKHGVSLGLGVHVFADPRHIVLASFRPIDGEDRFKAVGLVGGKLWTTVYVQRGLVHRLISVRRSNRGEQGNYHRHSGGPE